MTGVRPAFSARVEPWWDKTRTEKHRHTVSLTRQSDARHGKVRVLQAYSSDGTAQSCLKEPFVQRPTYSDVLGIGQSAWGRHGQVKLVDNQKFGHSGSFRPMLEASSVRAARNQWTKD